MKPFLWAIALLFTTALPLQSALVLGTLTCQHPHTSGSRYFARHTYLSPDVLRVRIAKKRFGLHETAALAALQRRYPDLGLEGVKTRVLRCTVYFEAHDDTRARYLFDAETLTRVAPEYRP